MGKKGSQKYAHYYPLIIDMYVDREMSLEDISKITGIPALTITRMLRHKEITIRNQGIPKGRKKKK